MVRVLGLVFACILLTGAGGGSVAAGPQPEFAFSRFSTSVASPGRVKVTDLPALPVNGSGTRARVFRWVIIWHLDGLKLPERAMCAPIPRCICPARARPCLLAQGRRPLAGAGRSDG
jgi:hypothetical protein